MESKLILIFMIYKLTIDLSLLSVCLYSRVGEPINLSYPIIIIVIMYIPLYGYNNRLVAENDNGVDLM